MDSLGLTQPRSHRAVYTVRKVSMTPVWGGVARAYGVGFNHG